MPQTPIDILLDRLVWKPLRPPIIEGDVPYATHAGVLALPDLPPLRVYVLSTGERIIEEDDLAAWLAAFGATDAP